MTKIIGILNITPDSFSDGGKYSDLDSAIKHTESMIQDGADIIDVGAESTRPGANVLSYQEEWQRLENILPDIINIAHRNNVEVSLDSYHPENLVKGINLGVDYINDVSAAKNKAILELAATTGAKIVINHNLGIPVNKNKIIPIECDPINYLSDWFSKQVHLYQNAGIDRNQIILDVGIGFGKNAKQSFSIIENIIKLQKFKLPIYVGHSRKSFLSEFDNSVFQNFMTNTDANISDKDFKTHEITKFLINKVQYIRVHNVKLAKQAC
jgi:dihydropteroate synthase